jgi:serine/threonine protein kinase
MTYCLNSDCHQPQNLDNAKFCQTCGSILYLKERYTAVKPIGQGGFGKTFLAVDEDKPSKPYCVIKQLNFDTGNIELDNKAKELFQREAIQLEKLGKHPQIPELLGYVEQDAHSYLIQEFIDGKNLAQILEADGPFNEEQIQNLLDKLLPVLEFMHSHRVIHRDIKPENIIYRPENQFVLVDFGVSKFVEETILLSRQTETQVGTPGFAAPEQLKGKASFASDLYGLGVTCIHLLTQVSPFDLFDSVENEWIWQDYLVDNSIHDKLASILDGLIANGMSRRYRTAKQVRQDLSVLSNSDALQGVWSGRFGSGKKGTLVITRHVGQSFEGVLIYEHWLHGTSRVQIEGCFDLRTNEIKAEETRILSEPWKGYWRLGTISGSLSSSGDSISGFEKDSRGKHYFSFKKRHSKNN